MKGAWFVILNCFFIVSIRAQELPQKEIDLQRFSDDLLGFQDENEVPEDAYENLLQVLSSPYDLNKVTDAELKSLNILTDVQIEHFIEYRTEQEAILDIHELQIIPGLDLAAISNLLPFVAVNDPLTSINRSLLRRIFSKGHSYFISRYGRTLETKKGFKTSGGITPAFQGSPDKLYFRFKSSLPGDFSFGLTGEKDAGEKMAFDHRQHQYGFDFSSCHFQIQNKGKLKNLIVGDYQTQFAQGLILGGAFGLGKGGETISTTRRSNLGFLPYTSMNESAYLRGIAFTLGIVRNIELSVFYSGTRRDASLNESDTVTSFQTTGYHRSRGEAGIRKKIMEHNYGIVVSYKSSSLETGCIINALQFDRGIHKTATPYNQFAFQGSDHLNTGLFLNYRVHNFSFFSEAGQSLGGGRGTVAGMLVTAHKSLDVSILYRRYDPDFYTFYSNAFSESTLAQNERGLYWGWRYKWNRRYSLSGYTDLFVFPWLAFRRYSPSKGYEWLLRGSYQPSKKTSILLQVREESKFRNAGYPSNLYQPEEGLKLNLLFHCDYGIGEKIRLKSRVQYSSYRFGEGTSQGFVIVQDLSFSTGKFKFTARHALFDTDNYDNRQYVYENDAWLAYSLPAYAGVGVRNYALIEFTMHKNLAFWLRYARTRLINEIEIGSGQDTIEGNTENDVKFQVRLKF
jgi:hypothetical protein